METAVKNHGINKSIPMKFIVVCDVESLDGKCLLSEICVLVINLGSMQVVSSYHALCQPPVKYQADANAAYIYRKVTGLSLQHLRTFGAPFPIIMMHLKTIRDTYPSARWYARQPEMERAILKQPDIGEVLDLFPPSMYNVLLHRKSRPADISAFADRVCRCANHEPVVRYSPHCASVDTWTLFFWIRRFGAQSNSWQTNSPSCVSVAARSGDSMKRTSSAVKMPT